MPSPIVSVIMPVFNAEKYVGEALASLVRQTFDDIEIVVVDDGSTDSSMKVVEGIDDPRVRIVRHSKNRGLPAARNTGLAAARGEYIAWLDADDISDPRRLERQVSFLRKHPHISLCGTWVRTIGEPAGIKWRYPTDPGELRSRMLFDDPIATSSVLLHTGRMNDIYTQFNEQYSFAEDYELWERISAQRQVSNVPQFLTQYRVHGAQTSSRNRERLRIAVWEIQRRQLAVLGIEPTDEEKALHLELGVQWLFRGTKEALEASEAWLCKLMETNRKVRVYPESAFENVIGHRWLFVCAAAAQFGMYGWRRYWASSLQKYAPFRPYGLTKSLLRGALSRLVGQGV